MVAARLFCGYFMFFAGAGGNKRRVQINYPIILSTRIYASTNIMISLTSFWSL